MSMTNTKKEKCKKKEKKKETFKHLTKCHLVQIIMLIYLYKS